MKTVLRYAGGKSKAYNKITPLIPPSVNKIISPFIGGGSLEVRWSTELNKRIIGFDIFYHLVNFWNVLLESPIKLYNELNKLEPTRDVYYEIKEKLLRWNKTQELFANYKTDYYKRKPIFLDNIKAAAYYFFNHNLSYGPMFLGWMSKNYTNKDRYKKMIEKIRKFEAPNLSVSEGSFEEIIPNYINDFMYLDPPYYLSEDNDNKMFKGMYPNPNFDFFHKKFEHNKLRDLLYNHRGDFVLSYNNCEIIREWYSEFDFYFPQWKYSYGQGETRIGKHKKNNRPKISHEILIVKNSKKRTFNYFFE